ncbi:MAG: hypothetical protein ACN2B6_04930 [Rickettsiales bacterium]
MKNILIVLAPLLLLAACDSKPRKDYAAIARCQDFGHSPGTAAYDQCVEDEQAANRLRQQRAEFERMKQDERDWKLRRY